MIIGGASLDPVVEKFLTSIRFPFTIGYGMTECAPLIAYAPWNNRRLGSCGRLVDRMEARIESPDPHVKPGELLLRGDNVMLGYYTTLKRLHRQSTKTDGCAPATWSHATKTGYFTYADETRP